MAPGAFVPLNWLHWSYSNFPCISESLSSTVMMVMGPPPPPPPTLCILQARISCLWWGDPQNARGSTSPFSLFLQPSRAASWFCLVARRGEQEAVVMFSILTPLPSNALSSFLFLGLHIVLPVLCAGADVEAHTYYLSTERMQHFDL